MRYQYTITIETDREIDEDQEDTLQSLVVDATEQVLSKDILVRVDQTYFKK